MRKILMPVDGSENALRAVRYAASMAQGVPSQQLFLLNVQEQVEPRMHAHLSHDQIQALLQRQADQVFAPLRKIAEAAGVACHEDWRTGPVAPTIAAYAREIGCDAIVMGTRGLSAIGNLVMGSTTTKVIHLADVPVTLVK